MGASLRVRRYESADSARCCAIINDAVALMDGLNPAARDHITASNVPERLGSDLERWTTLVVESDEGHVVGLGALDDDEIKRLYVDPIAHGLGAARALMSALEAIAQTRGLSTIRLDASPSSVGFHESLGYLVGRPASLEIGDASFHFVCMRKDLSRER